MTPIGAWLVWLVAAYLVGSIPFGFLMGKAKGIDLREHGSGNIGATNAGRVLGKRLGLMCFGLDVLKGMAPAMAYGLTHGLASSDELSSMTVLGALAWLSVAVAAAVVGHVFPIWLGFKGGKGVATALGMLLGVYPLLTWPGVIAGVVWLVVVKATGYVSLASVAAAVSLPLLATGACLWFGLPLGATAAFATLTAALAALVVLRHRSNLQRLRQGTEPKAGWTQKSNTPAN